MAPAGDDPHERGCPSQALRLDAVRCARLCAGALVLAALAWAYHRWTGYAGLWIHGIPWALALLAGLRALVQGVRWLGRRRADRRAQPAERSHSRR
ncbi:MAG: hypothetical protein V2J02_16935 [Pseudomonadales bacterium]|nr:hypothetical protein [Pseudomonadales bacterium]